MRLGFLNRLRNGYGNIYTPHAGSMIIQVQRETGLANRTIVISERQVALLRIVGSRVGLTAVAVFVATWLLFAVQSVRVPVLAVRIAELERDNRRIDSLQVALSRMHGRYEQVRQMLAVGGPAVVRPTSPAIVPPVAPNAKRAESSPPATTPAAPDTTTPVAR
ncbi:MAG: hypothetical protein ACJ785_10605 [Gemmatimonadaceae bacterium]